MPFISTAPAWRRAWQEVIPFLAFDPAIRNFENGGINVREWFAASNQFAFMLEQPFNA